MVRALTPHIGAYVALADGTLAGRARGVAPAPPGSPHRRPGTSRSTARCRCWDARTGRWSCGSCSRPAAGRWPARTSCGAAAAPRAADADHRPPHQVSPARACAFTVLRRVFEQGAYADRAFAAEASGLEPRDRALAMAMAYGAVQRRGDARPRRRTSCSAGRCGGLDAPVLAALRLGLFQILYLDGVADHAAVNESVELAKRSRPAAAGLVNAVLRRATTEGREILAGLDDRDPDAAAHAALGARHGWPGGGGRARGAGQRARCWWRSTSPRNPRCGSTRSSPRSTRWHRNWRCRTPPAPGIPEGLVLEGAFDAQGSAAFSEGAIMPQSRGSMLVSRVLGAGRRRARARPLRGARGQDHAPGGADGGRGRGGRGRAPLRARRRAAQDLPRGCTPSCVRVVTADAADVRGRARF